MSASGHVVFYKYWPGWALLWMLAAIALVGGGCGFYYYRQVDPLLHQRGLGIWLATGLAGGVVLVFGTARLWFDSLRTSSRPPGRGPVHRD